MKRMSTGHESYEHVLMCLICRSLFDDQDHQPKFLPCHHTFCKECLRQYVAQMGDEIECPSCRKLATIPAAGVAALQTNFYAKYIQNLVYGCVGNSTGWVSDCSRHHGHRLLYFCKDCALSICDTCRQERGCAQHRCDLLTAVVEQYRCDIDAAFARTNTVVENKKMELERLLKLLAKEKDHALIKIESTFEQHVHTLTRRATLLKNKVIDIYNEHAAKLDADLEEIATGMTCIVSLKEHYEPMISRGDFADAEKGIEELYDVHRNLSERIQPRASHILFEERHGVAGFQNCVKDLGRVISKTGELPVMKLSEEFTDDQSPRSDAERVTSPETGSAVNCDIPGILSENRKTVQPLQCSPSLQNPSSSDCSSSNFKTEMSVNIRNNRLFSALDADKNGTLMSNPAVSQKEAVTRQLEARSDVTDSNCDGYVLPNSDLASRKPLQNSSSSSATTASREEANNPTEITSYSSSTLTKQPDIPKLHTAALPGRCTGDGRHERNAEALPQVTLTLNLDDLRAVSICSENCSLANTAMSRSSVGNIPTVLGKLSSSSAKSDETVSAPTMFKTATETTHRCMVHKSYDEPRLRLELGCETSDAEDVSTTPSKEMSRSDFWLMMTSSVESNLSDHDMIVAELGGEQTSL